MKKKLIQSFRVILSVLFVFSAISKLLSLAFFDSLVAELFLGKAYYDHPDALWWTQLFTRLIISAELVLGVAVLQLKWFKRFTLPAIFLLLAIFTIHLFYVSFGLMAEGKNFIEAFLEGNCGCFGDIIPMDNFESIIKNLIAMAMTAYIWLKYDEEKEYHIKPIILLGTVGSVTLITLLLTIKNYSPSTEIIEYNNDITPSDTIDNESSKIMVDTTIVDTSEINKPPIKEIENNGNNSNAVKSDKSEPVVKETVKTEQSIFEKYTQFSGGITTDLTKGKKIVCLFSLTCGHCQEAYKELCTLSQEAKLDPMYLLCYGAEFDLNYFFSQAGCKHPYILVEKKSEFDQLLEGEDFPRILYMDNGEIEQSWNLETYSIESFKSYFGIKSKEKQAGGLQIEDNSNDWMGF